jgi:peptidoglycan/LPS O-acetylase OafA/YrhL
VRTTADAGPASPAIDRWHGVDALRAAVVLLGIALHAAVPYLEVPLQSLPWPIPATATSHLLGRFFWWFHAFQIPLFFLLAGFFAAHTAAARGADGFLRHRLRRLLRPLLTGGALLLPLTFAVFAAGWWLNDACTWNDIRRMKFAPPLQAELFGPAHLWFLEYLVIYCALFWVWRCARPKVTQSRRGMPWMLLGLCLPTALLLRVAPQVYTAHHNTFLPSLPVFLHHGLFFVAGTWLFAQRARVVKCRLGAAPALLLSLPFFIMVDTLLDRGHRQPLDSTAAWQFAAALAALIWLTVMGLATSAAAVSGQPSRRLAYVSAASYWLYLVHLPVLGIWQILLAPLGAPPLLAFSIAVSGTSFIGLWTYEHCVRGRWLGALLDGGAQARSTERALTAAATHR